MSYKELQKIYNKFKNISQPKKSKKISAYCDNKPIVDIIPIDILEPCNEEKNNNENVEKINNDDDEIIRVIENTKPLVVCDEIKTDNIIVKNNIVQIKTGKFIVEF